MDAVRVTDLLEIDRRPAPSDPWEPLPRRPRRPRWLLWIAAGVLLAASVGYLIRDQVQTRDSYDQAHTALGITVQRTRTTSMQLDEVHRELEILKTQVGSDSTALSQDASHLLGAQTALDSAKAHVTQQALLISSLKTCLAGVEQAMNELAIENQPGAIVALNSVSPSCSDAEAFSG